MNDSKLDKVEAGWTKYHKALEALGDGYWEWNVQTNKIKYSKQWKNLFGYKEEEFEDTIEAWEKKVHKDDIKKALKDINDYLIGETEIYANEHRIMCKDGTYKWVLDRGKIVEYSSNGKPLLLVGFKTDISTQKELKQTLEANKKLTNSLMSNIPGAAFRCLPDEDWTMKFLSNGILNLTGYENYNFINNKKITFENIIFESDKNSVRESINNVTFNNPIYKLEYRLVHKSGRLVWVKERGKGIFDDKNKLQFIDGIIFEISDRKQVENQLKKINLQIKQTSKMAKLGFWELDLIDNKLYWSSITRKIHDLPKNYEIKLASAINFYKEGKYRDEIKELVNNAIISGDSWETESKIITHKGREIWVKSTGVAELVNGKCVRLFGSFQDINQIKLNSEKLKSYDLLEKLTNSVPGAVYQFEQRKDKSINYKFLSENVKYLHKDLTKEAIIENPMLPFTFIHPDDWVGFENSMRGAYRNLKDWKYEYRVVNNDGSIYWHQAHSRPEKMEDESIVWYGYIHNITDLKLLQESLEQKIEEISRKNNELERFIEKNQELERFAYIVSHDLKEPLRTIKSFSEIIKMKYLDKLDEDGVVYFDLIASGATRMMGLIEGILEYSRIDEEKGINEQVDINQILLLVLNDLKSVIKDTNATVSVENLCKVKCNPLQIRQLFQNLISNAIKFSSNSEDCPIVEVSCIEDEDGCVFAVKDNGIGIDSQQLESVFGMFKRLHSREDYQGYGIGLSLCKKIVEKHNGKIWVESDGKSGSTFYFSIPQKK